MKPCPYCAEQIQDAAIVCRFCNRAVAQTATQATTVATAPRPPMSVGMRVFWLLVAMAAGVVLVFFLMFASVVISPAGSRTNSPADRDLTTWKIADREEMLRKVVVSAGESCSEVTRSYHQGTSPKGDQFWNIGCDGTESFVVLINNDARGSTRVMSCDRAGVFTRARCFEPLKP